MIIEKRKGKSSLLTINGITKTTSEWASENGITTALLGERLRQNWPEEKLFIHPEEVMRNPFNKNYFDVIDDEHKAYWLGFIWCDGYMAIRNREGRNSTSYEFKLTLKKDDYGHLKKFNQDLNGNYKIHFYKSQGFNRSEEFIESRLLITNQYFGKTLAEKYGLIPNRTDCSKIIQAIPEYLMKHFIRGLIDADGSFCHYIAEESNEYGIYITQI